MNFVRKCLTPLLAAMAAFSMSQTAMAGGATATCDENSWNMTGWGPQGGPNIVNARCKNYNGDYIWSSAWMPGYLANWNGRLAWWGDGYYDRSCTTIGLRHRAYIGGLGYTKHLDADCWNGSGAKVRTDVNLNDGLTNRNGYLGW